MKGVRRICVVRCGERERQKRKEERDGQTDTERRKRNEFRKGVVFRGGRIFVKVPRKDEREGGEEGRRRGGAMTTGRCL